MRKGRGGRRSEREGVGGGRGWEEEGVGGVRGWKGKQGRLGCRSYGI